MEASRLFDRVQIGALEVLDQAQHEAGLFGQVTANDGRDPRQPGQARCSPAALARDQLVALRGSPDQHWLQHALGSNGIGQLAQGLAFEPAANLVRGGPDLIQ